MRVHESDHFRPGLGLPGEAFDPAPVPRGERNVSSRGRGAVGSQVPEGVGVVGPGFVHPAQQFLGERGVLRFGREQAELGPLGGEPVLLKMPGERFDQFLGTGQRGFRFRVQDGQQGLGETGQIPGGHLRLLPEGVAALLVDGAEDRRRIVGIQEGAGTVVQGFAGQRHVVGVHHSMHESHAHPVGQQHGLPLHDHLQEGVGRILGRHPVREMAAERVVGQPAQ